MTEIITIPLGHPEYPLQLASIKNPPEQLYCMGDLTLLHSRMVAIVGSRKSSEYGRWAANTLAFKLASRGVAVVSGLAAGIDAEAHRGALEAKGGTVAVLGCGVDICYPRSNKILFDAILKRGLLVSEYPPGHQAAPYTFPQRNRIISGLAEAVVVASAGLHSGALITAEQAADQGRQVYAVPGNINSIFHLGSNLLIRDGASPLVVLDDLLEEMGFPPDTLERAGPALSPDEKALCCFLLSHGESTVETLCRQTGKPPSEVNGLLTVLEMKGVIRTSLGKVFLAK